MDEADCEKIKTDEKYRLFSKDSFLRNNCINAIINRLKKICKKTIFSNLNENKSDNQNLYVPNSEDFLEKREVRCRLLKEKCKNKACMCTPIKDIKETTANKDFCTDLTDKDDVQIKACSRHCFLDVIQQINLDRIQNKKIQTPNRKFKSRMKGEFTQTDEATKAYWEVFRNLKKKKNCNSEMEIKQASREAEQIKTIYFQDNRIHNISSELKNRSSMELERLLNTRSSSSTFNKNICYGKPYEYGDYLPLGVHDVNYSTIIIERCKNKGCMCKPIDVVVNRGQKQRIDNNAQTGPPLPIPDSKKNESDSNRKGVQFEPDTNNAENQTSNPVMRTKEAFAQVELILECECKKKKGKKQKSKCFKSMCKKKKSKCSDCSYLSTTEEIKFCLPCNFEEILQNSVDKEIRLVHCNKENCCCQIKEPQKCKKDEKKNKKSSSESKTSLKSKDSCCKCNKSKKNKKELSTESSTTCGGKKKKNCCFKRKNLSKEEREKSVQTLRICYFDQNDQANLNQDVKNENCLCECSQKPDTGNSKSICLCSKCGKIYSCKKYEKSGCPKNTIVLPPKHDRNYCSCDQVDTLRLLIKMEAKQNYRQINNLLNELNEQRSQIKKLNEMYQTVIRNMFENGIEKELPSNDKKSDYRKQGTQNITICHRCDLDFERKQSRDVKNAENINKYQYENKHIKNLLNKSKCANSQSGAARGKLQVNEAASVAAKNKDARKNLPIKISHLNGKEPVTVKNNDSVLTLFEDVYVVNEEAPQNNLKEKDKSSSEYDETQDFVKVGSKESLYDEKSTTREKCLKECNSRSKAFKSWCKKSFDSLKEKESKCLKKCNRYLQNRFNQCKNNCKNKATKKIIAYCSHYCK